MNETRKTMIFGGAALFLALLALITSPGKVTPDAFLDQGELFFPDFEDPNTATTLEVYDFDQETGSVRPFKVTFEGGRWLIPSHHDYPADGKDRLAKTAAGVIGIRKDDFRSDNPAEHEVCGVIDPLDETGTALQGRGKRVTIKGENGVVLADFIFGNEIEGRSGFRFVRVPGQKRVYAARVDLDISTNFTDWIEADLLTVEKDKINKVVILDYSINEQTRKIEERGQITLTKDDGSTWKAAGMRSTEEVQPDSIRNFLTALDNLSIVGVRPKPAGLSASLTKTESGISITQSDMLSLQSKGYFFTQDGSLRSNEGELKLRTDDGVAYTLRFGEIFAGSGLAVSAGTDPEEAGGQGSEENRYLFITAEFDNKFFKEPPKPADTSFLGKPDSLMTDSDRSNKEMQETYDEWSGKIEKGRKLTEELNARFADWYYVISAENFDKLHLSRSDLVRPKETDKK